MIRTRWMVACFFAFAASAAMALAQEQESEKKVDPTGTWKWERTFNENTIHYTLRLAKQEEKLAGTIAVKIGDQEREPSEIKDAKLEGNKLSFTTTRQFNDREITIAYEGTVSEAGIEGTTRFAGGGGDREFEWQAKRGLDWQDVLGEWKVTAQTPDGNSFEWTLNFTKEGEDVKGTVTSERFGENELVDIAIKDAQLTFDLVFERDGNEFRLNYKVEPRGDQLKGSVQFGEEAERTLEFTGERAKAATPKDDTQAEQP